MTMTQNQLLEELAELEHEQWCEWVKYMFSNLDPTHIDRWARQAYTAYKDLPPDERESDIEWAQKALDIVNKHLQSKTDED